MKVTTPFNIRLLDAVDNLLMVLPRVTSGDVIDQIGTRNLHPEGLYSTVMFGDIGSTDRNNRFAYIRLNTTVLHPYVFQNLKKLKSLYTGIIMGKEYAVWDKSIKDFVKADESDPNADTGMSFFMQYFKQIDFKATESVRRDVRISNVSGTNAAIMHNLMVIPAGMRDIRFDNETGQIEEEEINNYYKSVIFLSNNIELGRSRGEHASLDHYRREIQLKVNQIYETLKNMIDGKKKIIQSQWGSRNIMNSTRNVIVPLNSTTEILGDSRSPSVNQTVIGLYQAMKMYLPITINRIKGKWLSKVFEGIGGNANLIEVKSLKLVNVPISPEIEDMWLSNEGIEKLITNYKNKNIRRKPVMVGNHYFGLIYRDETKYEFIHSLDNLPEGWDKLNVYPITWMELFYLSAVMDWYERSMTNTRYPVAGLGSIYPTKCYVKTTNHTSRKDEYEFGEPTGLFAREYPDLSDISDYNAMAVSSIRLKNLGAD